MTDRELPNFDRLYLKPEYQEDANQFAKHYEDIGCTCHLGHPPCSYCTHPGNPLCLEEDDDAWMDPLEAAIRYFNGVFD